MVWAVCAVYNMWVHMYVYVGCVRGLWWGGDGWDWEVGVEK